MTDDPTMPGAGEGGLARRIEDLEALIERQQGALDHQRQVIEGLSARLDEVAPTATTSPPPVRSVDGRSTPPTDDPRPAPTDAVTSRRALMTRGAVAAAGAAVAGTAAVVATAGPAAAAQGNFDGNPGVIGSAEPGSGVGVHGQASTGQGVTGLATTTGTGVRGTADTGIGVLGVGGSTSGATTGVRGEVTSPGGIAVVGENLATSGEPMGMLGRARTIGVRGESTGTTGEGAGLFGAAASSDGFGVIGASEGTGVGAAGADLALLVQSDGVQIRLTGEPGPPLTSGRPGVSGDLVYDEFHDLWLCVSSGNPGTWRRISGPGTAGAFVALQTPIRVYDSRPPFPPATGPKTKLTPNQARTVDCTLQSTGVNARSTGVLVSLVATGSNAAGHVAIYRDTIPYPNTSNANFASGQTVAVTTFSAVTAGKVAVLSNQSIDVVIDVLGFYQ